MSAMDPKLETALDQWARMHRVLASLRAEVLPNSPEWYAVMAEGPIHRIRKLEREIRQLTGTERLTRTRVRVNRVARAEVAERNRARAAR